MKEKKRRGRGRKRAWWYRQVLEGVLARPSRLSTGTGSTDLVRQGGPSYVRVGSEYV
jgi:hypothetical protein